MAATTTLGLAVLSVPPALAGTATPAPGATTAPAAQPPAESAATKAIRAAFAEAKRTGRPVVVDELTTETSQTTADPDGRTLSSDAVAQDVRTKRDGRWQTLDTTLKANADGTVTPALTGSDLVLSGGGTGPLATISTADGKKLSISAPFTLPKPTLNGGTATYASVLPDVDLEVTARPDGGWRDVIVVKTAQAAADPRLKSLHFPLRTTGLQVASDRAGNVSLTDEGGKVRMHAPTPFQWDSTRPAPPAPLLKPAQAAPKSLFAAPAAPAAADAQAEADRSTTGRPGPAAAVSAMAVTASASELVLTPDQNTFGKGTGPWYLDPETSVDNGRQVNAQVQENHPDTSNVNTLSSLGVGYCGYSDCTGYGRYRSYYQLSTPNGLFEGNGHGTAKINRATLLVDVPGASSPGTKSTINVYSAPAFQGTTTWNNQPCGTNGKMVGCTWAGNSDITGTGSLSYDVTWWMQKIVNEKIPAWTIGFSAEDEYDKLLRHHLGANPHVVTYYDIAPTVWAPRTTPQPGYVNDPVYGNQRNDCQTPGGSAWNAPGWVGANQFVYLHANSWSPIGANVTTNYHIWDDNQAGWHAYPSAAGGSWNSDAPASVGNLTDGHQYGWLANVTDGSLTSGDTPWCYFRVDKTAPTVSVTSTDFPASGTVNATPKLKVNQQGTFTVTSSDPAPGTNLHASGVACVRWSADPTPVTGWTCSSPNVVDATNTFKFTPASWGTNTLFVQAMDRAGNYSQPFPYTFYAPWNAATGAAVPGDLNGDKRVDLLQADAKGNLRMMTGNTDPGTAVSAPPGLAPAGSTWDKVQTSHLGALRSFGVDDVLVHVPSAVDATKSPFLYVYPNKNDGTFSTSGLVGRPSGWVAADGTLLDTAPTGWNADWSHVSQFTALGAPKALLSPLDSDLAKDYTSAVTVEDGRLWLYRSNSINNLDADATAVSTATTWGGYELYGPGAASGYAQPTLWSRDGSGTIRSYAVKTKGDGTLDVGALATPTGGTVLGTGYTTGLYPKMGSNGDLNGDGLADLWALDTANHLRIFPGVAGDSSKPTAVTGFGTATDQGDARPYVDRLKLDTSAGTAPVTTPDVFGRASGVVSGGVTFPTDTVNGRSTKVARFDGENGEIKTPGLGVDPTKSFAVSLWTKPEVPTKKDANGNLIDGVVISQSNNADSAFMVWAATLGDGNVNWHLGMSTADNNGWPYDTTDTRSAAARVQFGTWTRLTVSYNAQTGQMALYVNGALASTGIHKTKQASTGPLVLGHYRYQSSDAWNYYKGSVSDLTVYDGSIDPGTLSGPLTADAAANVCAEVKDGLTAAGTPVQTHTCTGGAGQQWKAQPNGTIQLAGRCLDATGGGTVNGTRIQLWDCLGGTATPNANQVWTIRPDGSIYNDNSKRCLDIPNAVTADGNQLELYDCNSTPAQRWLTRPVV
ncbi:ricin-type beta-trefoil lectin domain protein [Kitasatospora sp. NPDC001664]